MPTLGLAAWSGRVRGLLARMTGVDRDLRECEKRFRQLLDRSVDAIFIHDERGRILDCNSEACRSLGYTREELLKLSVRDFATNLISEEEKRSVGEETLWRRALSSEPGVVTGIHLGEHRRKDGATFPVEVSVGAIDYRGRRLIVASARDVTERVKLEAQLRHRAFHDDLTGLPNRALFLDRLDQAFARARRGGGSVAVLFVDLDGFKQVNDRYGHDAGDEALVVVAGWLRECVRAEDTVARYGGDEFTVVLEGVANEPDAVRVAERILQTLRRPVRLRGGEARLGASVGIALGSSPGTAPEDLIRRADAAMYRAKGDGRYGYSVYGNP